MKTYYFEFTGRQVGAIGITENHVKEVRAETYDKAVTKLYDTHEHISIKYWSEWTGKQRTGGTVIESAL